MIKFDDEADGYSADLVGAGFLSLDAGHMQRGQAM